MTTETVIKTSTILQKTIEDIDNGNWVCNVLRDESGKMGCAIGLVGFHGRCGKWDEINPNIWIMTYPNQVGDDFTWSEEAKMAVELLSKTVPGNGVWDSYNDDKDRVVLYNDSLRTVGHKGFLDGGFPGDVETARAWFVRAHKLALERGL